MGTLAEVLPTVTAVVGGLAGIIGTSVTFRKQLEEKFSTELHARRMETYPKLWGILEGLSIHPPASVSSRVAAQLSEDMKEWYYRDGGFFLSTQSRKRYTRCQELLRQAASGDESPSEDEIRKEASLLRTEMAGDCSTRKRTHL